MGKGGQGHYGECKVDIAEFDRGIAVANRDFDLKVDLQSCSRLY